MLYYNIVIEKGARLPEFVAEVMENQWSSASLRPAAEELQDWLET